MIIEEIMKCGAVRWERVMQEALHAPSIGYYRGGVQQIGRGGDFYTSVSVGPFFGELLGVFIARVWRALGSPEGLTLIEQGAHDGSLAADVLRGLRKNEPSLFAAARLVIVEPDDDMKAVQCATLEQFRGKLHHVLSWDDLVTVPEHAVIYCNELPDAMPVCRVRHTSEGWRELGVTLGAHDDFEFVEMDLGRPELADELQRAAGIFPEGYETDVNLSMLRWIRELSCARFHGAALILDYGLTMEEYFSPERNKGTLRRYRNHRCDDRVLENLGECDLTAHVNFTRLAQEAAMHGMNVFEFIEQGRFLSALAAGHWAKSSSPPDAATQRQFHALTHPGIMGCSFHALALAKGIEPEKLASGEQIASASRRLEIAI